jgi:hypothetical protein
MRLSKESVMKTGSFLKTRRRRRNGGRKEQRKEGTKESRGKIGFSIHFCL